MKNIPALFFLTLTAFFSCTENKNTEQAAGEMPEVTIKEVSATSQNCIPDSMSCTYVRFEYPVFNDSAKQNINSAITDKMKEIAGGVISDDGVLGTLEHMAQIFILDYEAFTRDFPGNRIGWYVKVNAVIIHESQDVITCRIDAEYFTGGAHPNSSIEYLVLDAETGRALGLADIVSDTVGFKLLTEQSFRKSKGMEAGQSYADIGFYIDDEEFTLSKNIGVTDEGIVIHFNPYEIAPYSMGATTIEVNKEVLSDMLKVQ